MPHPQLNVDRARAWLDALPHFEHRHGVALLVSEGADGERRHCAIGVCAETAHADGHPIDARVVADDETGIALLDYVDTRTGDRDPYGLLTDWLGIDPATVRVRLEQLPAWLTRRIKACIDADRVARPWIAGWWDRDTPLGHAVWRLSDASVPFDLIADALRVALDVDPHRVPGTVEHGLCAAQEAAEADPWGDGTPEPAAALSAAGAR